MNILIQIAKKLHLGRIYTTITYPFLPWGWFTSYITFPIFVFLRTKNIGRRDDLKIANLKNCHKGERCFVIATGPSLVLEDVEKIKHETTLAVNSIFRLYDKTDWRPDYYVFLDPNLYKTYYKKGFIDLDSFYKKACILNSLDRNIAEARDLYFVHTNWLDHMYNYGSSEFKYTDDLRYGINDFYSVTQDSICLAMYMGFSEIYLLGADNDYLGDKIHFIKTDGDLPIDYELAIKTQKCMDMAYNELKRIADERDIKIYNATRGGKLEVFPRVTIENILNENR